MDRMCSDKDLNKYMFPWSSLHKIPGLRISGSVPVFRRSLTIMTEQFNFYMVKHTNVSVT